MTTAELKDTLARLTDLMNKPKGEVKRSALALCCAQIVCAVEDENLEIPAEAFAVLGPDERKLALTGMVWLVNQAFNL